MTGNELATATGRYAAGNVTPRGSIPLRALLLRPRRSRSIARAYRLHPRGANRSARPHTCAASGTSCRWWWTGNAPGQISACTKHGPRSGEGVAVDPVSKGQTRLTPARAALLRSDSNIGIPSNAWLPTLPAVKSFQADCADRPDARSRCSTNRNSCSPPQGNSFRLRVSDAEAWAAGTHQNGPGPVPSRRLSVAATSPLPTGSWLVHLDAEFEPRCEPALCELAFGRRSAL